MAFFEIIQ